MIILGINGWYTRSHDPSACLIRNGKILAMAEEERFIRQKYAVEKLPLNAIGFCLNKAGIKPDSGLSRKDRNHRGRRSACDCGWGREPLLSSQCLVPIGRDNLDGITRDNSGGVRIRPIEEYLDKGGVSAFDVAGKSGQDTDDSLHPAVIHQVLDFSVVLGSCGYPEVA